MWPGTHTPTHTVGDKSHNVSIITQSALPLLTHTHTNESHHAPKACQPIWLGDNKPNSQQHVSCTPGPGKPKECTSLQLAPALYLPLSAVCLSFPVFSLLAEATPLSLPPLLRVRVGIRVPYVCVFVRGVCQRNQSDESARSVPLGWRGEGEGMREGK